MSEFILVRPFWFRLRLVNCLSPLNMPCIMSVIELELKSSSAQSGRPSNAPTDIEEMTLLPRYNVLQEDSQVNIPACKLLIEFSFKNQ